jgi:hypothetical protein
MRAAAAIALAFGIASACSLAGCATYSDDLTRAQRAYEGSEDERALAIFRVLEADTSRLSDSERAHYDYLRGMTDFRMGYQAESRHWLSLAASMEQQIPGSLPPEWAKKLTDTLKELNESVYSAGIESLTNTAAPKAKTGDDEGSSSSAPPPTDTSAKPAKKSSDD